MTTIKEVPADLVHALGLHDGDRVAVKEKRGAFTLEITHSLRKTAQKAEPKTEDEQSKRKAAFERFARGAQLDHEITDEEMDDGRLQYLLEKHLK